MAETSSESVLSSRSWFFSFHFDLVKCFCNLREGSSLDLDDSYFINEERLIKTDEESRFTLACRLIGGVGVPKDPLRGVDVLRQMALNEHDMSASIMLSSCLKKGIGLERDEDEAMEVMSNTMILSDDVSWLKELFVDEGDEIEFLSFLVYKLSHTWSLRQFLVGLNCLKKLTDAKNSNAELFLGLCYLNGWGLESNLTSAKDWIQRSAVSGNQLGEAAMKELSAMSDSGMSQTPAVELTSLLIGLHELYNLSKGNNLEAQFELGQCFLSGHDLAINKRIAQYWLRVALKFGHSGAKKILDMAEFAFEPFGDAKTLYGIGLSHFPDTMDKALTYFGKAAEMGEADAQFAVGVCYSGPLSGEGKGERDWKSAAKWFKKAANQRHAFGEMALARCFREGRGVERNAEKEKELTQRFHKHVKGQSGNQNPIAEFFFDRAQGE